MEDSGDEMIGPKLSEQKEPELLVREDDWRKDAPLRDWDKGKDFKEFKGWLFYLFYCVCGNNRFCLWSNSSSEVVSYGSIQNILI